MCSCFHNSWLSTQQQFVHAVFFYTIQSFCPCPLTDSGLCLLEGMNDAVVRRRGCLGGQISSQPIATKPERLPLVPWVRKQAPLAGGGLNILIAWGRRGTVGHGRPTLPRWVEGGSLKGRLAAQHLIRVQRGLSPGI